MSGIMGIKCGTTRVYSESEKGGIEQATVISVQPNFITMIKTKKDHGYEALQLSSVEAKTKHLKNAQKKRYERLGIAPQKYVKELRLYGEKNTNDYKEGDSLTVALFTGVKKVHVAAKSKGKGFAGCVKRHGFAMQRATHGNSLSHRAPGSIGQCQDPGRVNPGKKMAGRMGHVSVTVKNLVILKIDEHRNLLVVKGSVPGAKGALVFIKSEEITGRE